MKAFGFWFLVYIAITCAPVWLDKFVLIFGSRCRGAGKAGDGDVVCVKHYHHWGGFWRICYNFFFTFSARREVTLGEASYLSRSSSLSHLDISAGEVVCGSLRYRGYFCIRKIIGIGTQPNLPNYCSLSTCPVHVNCLDFCLSSDF